MKETKDYVINTEDGHQYQLLFIHPEFGRMIIRITDSDEDKYKDIDELEDDMVKLMAVTYIFCIDGDTGDSIIVTQNIVKDSVLVIHEIK